MKKGVTYMSKKYELIKEKALLEDEVRRWKLQYKVELLKNQAYSHIILQLAMSGIISHEAQKMIYDMFNNETQFIFKKLYDEIEL